MAVILNFWLMSLIPLCTGPVLYAHNLAICILHKPNLRLHVLISIKHMLAICRLQIREHRRAVAIGAADLLYVSTTSSSSHGAGGGLPSGDCANDDVPALACAYTHGHQQALTLARERQRRAQERP
jgi:hypothetical protein